MPDQTDRVIKLKPCPFCGVELKLVNRFTDAYGRKRAYINHPLDPTCMWRLAECHFEIEEAIKYCNQRAARADGLVPLDEKELIKYLKPLIPQYYAREPKLTLLAQSICAKFGAPQRKVNRDDILMVVKDSNLSHYAKNDEWDTDLIEEILTLIEGGENV